ncbi:MAG: glycosyltransferase, partial [Desulfovibrio sp.]
RHVLDALPDTRFILAGNGDLLPRMMRRAGELRMGSRFHFPGFMRGEDVRHMYSIASLYVMPSVSEPFGIAPLEALQCGAPVLMSKQSGSAEVLPSAFTVDFWNVREMADLIINILRYPEMASASLRLCQEELKLLTWERAANGILDAYARVCPNARS